MYIKNFKEINKGCLCATFDLHISQLGMTIRDIAYMKKETSRWLNMPNKKFEVDGEEKRFSFVHFEPERKKKLEKVCFEKIDNNDFERSVPPQDVKEDKQEKSFTDLSFFKSNDLWNGYIRNLNKEKNNENIPSNVLL